MEIHDYAMLALVVLYSLVFVAVVVQLGRIMYHKHKLLSFQVGFLVCCFWWMLLRIIFFVTFLVLWEDIPEWFGQIFSVLPINVEFATFSLLVLFYASVIRRSADRNSRDSHSQGCSHTMAYITANSLFLLADIVWCVYVKSDVKDHFDRLETIRLAYTAVVFGILTILLFVYSIRLQRILRGSGAHVPFQAKSTSNRQMLVLTFSLLFLFFTRSVWDVVTVSLPKHDRLFFGPGVQATPWQQTAMFAAMFFWEILPSLLVIFFFRNVPRSQPAPRKLASKGPYLPVSSQAPRKPLFTNPNRYDDEDETTAVTPASPAMYGTPGYYHYASNSPSPPFVLGTTPRMVPPFNK